MVGKFKSIESISGKMYAKLQHPGKNQSPLFFIFFSSSHFSHQKFGKNCSYFYIRDENNLIFFRNISSWLAKKFETVASISGKMYGKLLQLVGKELKVPKRVWKQHNDPKYFCRLLLRDMLWPCGETFYGSNVYQFMGEQPNPCIWIFCLARVGIVCLLQIKLTHEAVQNRISFSLWVPRSFSYLKIKTWIITTAVMITLRGNLENDTKHSGFYALLTL